MVHQSDLVQRIGRVREHKTQVENRFRGWPWMLVNGVLAFALERGIGTVRMPTSELAMRHTDPSRSVQPYMFERIYDRPPAELPGTARRGEWWEIDVRAAAAAVVEPVAGSEPLAEERTVCVMHDLERGLGHREEDPDLAREAEATGGRTARGDARRGGRRRRARDLQRGRPDPSRGARADRGRRPRRGVPLLRPPPRRRPAPALPRGRLPPQGLPAAALGAHPGDHRRAARLPQLRVAREQRVLARLRIAAAAEPSRAPAGCARRLPAVHGRARLRGVGGATCSTVSSGLPTPPSDSTTATATCGCRATPSCSRSSARGRDFEPWTRSQPTS